MSAKSGECVEAAGVAYEGADDGGAYDASLSVSALVAVVMAAVLCAELRDGSGGLARAGGKRGSSLSGRYVPIFSRPVPMTERVSVPRLCRFRAFFQQEEWLEESL